MPSTYVNPNKAFQEQGSSVYAPTTTPISADVLNTPKLPALPQAATPTPVAFPAVPSVADILGSTPADTPLSTAFTTSTINTANTSAALAGEGGFRSTQEQTYDLAGKKATANDLTNRFNGLKAQANQIPLQIQQDFTGRGATAGGIAPIQTGELRNNAIQQIGISAMLNAANGNLSTAQDQVEYAVKAKFDPLKAQLAAQQAQLAAITPLLAREDKKRATTQAALLDERARLLTKQEAEQKTIYQTMLSAAQYGADATILRNIQNAPTPEAALAAAGPALSAKFRGDQKQQEFDNNIKLAKLAIDQQKANTSDRHNANTSDRGGTYDPAQILAYAQQYASDGKIPTGIPKGSFGVLSQVAKELPKPDGALISNNTGVSPSALSATQTAGFQALSDIVTKTLPQLQELFPKISTGILGGIGGKIYTSQDRQDYLTAKQEFLNKLLVARSGATVTPQEYDRYAKMLPGEFNQPLFLGSDGSKKLNSMAKNLNSSLQSNLATNQLSIVGYSTVKIAGQDYKVGQIVANDQGIQGRVNADGTVTYLNQ